MLAYKPKQDLNQQTGLHLSHKFWNDPFKIQSNKSMS